MCERVSLSLSECHLSEAAGLTRLPPLVKKKRKEGRKKESVWPPGRAFRSWSAQGACHPTGVCSDIQTPLEKSGDEDDGLVMNSVKEKKDRT